MKLYIDHFFKVLNQSDFEEAKALVKYIPCSEHKIVRSDDDSWEGIYFLSKCGTYIELLKESDRRIVNQLGLSFSNTDEKEGLFDFLKINTNLSWSCQPRNDSSGKPWFKSIILNTDKEVFIWGMEYEGEHIERRKKMGKNPSNIIESIDALETNVPSDLFEKLPEYLIWTHQKTQTSHEQTTFSIPKKDLAPFTLIVNNSFKSNHLFSINLTLSTDDPISGPEAKCFVCKQSGRNLQIYFRK